MTFSPASSERESDRCLNREASGSSPERGSTYLYAVVRKDLSGGSLLAQFGHAVTECLRAEDLPLPIDTRIVVLAATKEQMAALKLGLHAAEVPHKAILETDGPLTGVITAIGLVTANRDALKPLLGELKVWR